KPGMTEDGDRWPQNPIVVLALLLRRDDADRAPKQRRECSPRPSPADGGEFLYRMAGPQTKPSLRAFRARQPGVARRNAYHRPRAERPMSRVLTATWRR